MLEICSFEIYSDRTVFEKCAHYIPSRRTPLSKFETIDDTKEVNLPIKRNET